uniref:Uncharacterized protein LOC111110036 n=1 Tax=Crassostrea virginica TaxID=6565 RepID=A0A8B8BGE9_CRAVI|nr:uncharacterized protein LOC111110036 [Crassostrea virginica]
MENHFRIFCVIFVIMVIRNSVLCITEEEINKIVERRMEKVIRKYDKKIALLEEKIHVKIQNMEKKCSTPDAEEEREKVSFQHTAVNLDNNTHLQGKIVSHVSKRRDNQLRIVQGDSGHIAFCAYMTTREISPSLHHTIVFDSVKANIGSAYNSISGFFTAPANGLYVFSWTIFSSPNSFIFTQIIVNSNALDSMVTDSEHVADTHSGTKVIVVGLNRGDMVYVRTHPTTLSHGDVSSSPEFGQPSFCGWKL